MPDIIRSTLDGSLEEIPRKLRGRKMVLHTLLFLFIFLVDVADVINDWLFFADVVAAERGLVYGKPEPAIIWCLLLFSIIGVVTFIFECINLWWEFFRNNPWMDSDWLSAVVIWIEDVPQIIISMYLVLCREEPISIFQLSKASVILISVVVRIVVTSVKYCNRKAMRSHHHVKIKAMIMLGIIIEALGACVIFFITQTERTYSGQVSFRVPSTFLEEAYNDQRYLADVSLFMHDPDISGGRDPKTIDWIHLNKIFGIRHMEHESVSYKLEYSTAGSSTTNLAISTKQLDSDPWTLSECYSIDKNTAIVTQVPISTCSKSNFFNNSTKRFIKLWYERPGFLFKIKVFGDIHINIMKEQNSVCTPVSEYADSIESSKRNNVPLVFHYYRTNETLQHEDMKHLLNESGVSRFYRDSDLIDTNKVWMTGWRECEGGGNIAPIFNGGLKLSCS
jgi:hypothetical protein